VSIAMWIAMTLASILGVSIPLLLMRFKKDPALASGPLITTFNDLVALNVYFLIATLFL
jgi:magnesium transporter